MHLHEVRCELGECLVLEKQCFRDVAEDLGELLHPLVRYGDHADVRLDRRERVVRREHVVLGQRVEQGGLADVGQADDADSESHDPPAYRRGAARPPAQHSATDARVSLEG